MKIEVGKCYVSFSGAKIGPMCSMTVDFDTWFYDNDRIGRWNSDGTMFGAQSGYGALVAEWSDGPVREVVTTRREIVPGVYGGLVVDLSPAKGYVSVGIGRDARIWTAPELRAAASVLTQLADVLEQ